MGALINVDFKSKTIVTEEGAERTVLANSRRRELYNEDFGEKSAHRYGSASELFMDEMGNSLMLEGVPEHELKQIANKFGELARNEDRLGLKAFLKECEGQMLLETQDLNSAYIVFVELSNIYETMIGTTKAIDPNAAADRINDLMDRKEECDIVVNSLKPLIDSDKKVY